METRFSISRGSVPMRARSIAGPDVLAHGSPPGRPTSTSGGPAGWSCGGWCERRGGALAAGRSRVGTELSVVRPGPRTQTGSRTGTLASLGLNPNATLAVYAARRLEPEVLDELLERRTGVPEGVVSILTAEGRMPRICSHSI